MRTWPILLVCIPLVFILLLVIPPLVLPPEYLSLAQPSASIIQILAYAVVGVAKGIRFVRNPRSITPGLSNNLWLTGALTTLHLIRRIATVRVEVRCRETVHGLSFDFSSREGVLFRCEQENSVKQTCLDTRTVFEVKDPIVNSFQCDIRVYAARGEEGLANIAFSSTTVQRTRKGEIGNKLITIDLSCPAPEEQHLVVYPCGRDIVVRQV